MLPISARRRVSMDPEEIADAYVREADVLAGAKRYEEANAVYDRAIGVYPECSEAWTNKACVLRLLGRLQEALECAEKALEIGPSPIAEALCDNLVDELRRKGIIR
jgi:tetratricopeptide (TPR) repeat protein